MLLQPVLYFRTMLPCRVFVWTVNLNRLGRQKTGLHCAAVCGFPLISPFSTRHFSLLHMFRLRNLDAFAHCFFQFRTCSAHFNVDVGRLV
jgi:hypothetical protein